jgi:putative transposase
MARTSEAAEPLPTIWHASDELWARVEPVLAELDPPAATGRPRIDPRGAFDAVIYRGRTGCQWNALPDQYPDDASVHRTFQRWVDRGVLARLWAALVEDCEELGGVDWQWQSADCCLGKARHGGTRSAPTRPTGPRTAPSGAC